MKKTYKSIVTEINSDTETPISIYHKLCADRPYSFLLESAEQDSRMGRYSFIGFDPVDVLHSDGADSIEELKRRMDNIDIELSGSHKGFEAGYVGYFSYESVRHIEKIPVPEMDSDSGIPESVFFMPKILVVFDHFKHSIYLHCLEEEGEDVSDLMLDILNRLNRPHVVPPIPEKTGEAAFEISPSRDKFLKNVNNAKEAIASGEAFQIVLSRSIRSKTKKSDFDLYRSLRHNNPSPYMYFIKFDDFSVVGASPETLVRVEDGEVLLRPIAGTRPIDGDELEMRSDPKECAEHMMLVDLGRNDIGRIAKQGTVEVPELMYVQRFSTVMHMVSDVVGRVREDVDMFDVFRACFPAGTLSGAPKVRACEIISRLEGRRRGIYGGAVGYFDFSGNMDFAIGIRTMICRGEDVFLQAGAGIVADSVPEKELEECLHKAKSCLSVI